MELYNIEGYKELLDFPGYFINKEGLVVKKVTRKMTGAEKGLIETVYKPISYMSRKDSPHIEFTVNGKRLVRKISLLVDSMFGVSVDGVIIDECRNYILTKDLRVYSTTSGRYLRPTINHAGYFVVNLLNDSGKKTVKYMHRLIATSFLEGNFEGAHVNHIDGNKLNNSLCNLEWCTNEQNLKHAWSTGLNANKYRECRISLDNISWINFNSLKEAKEYIEKEVGCIMPNVSKLSKTAKDNATEGKTNRGICNKLNPFRCRGYIVRYV